MSSKNQPTTQAWGFCKLVESIEAEGQEFEYGITYEDPSSGEEYPALCCTKEDALLISKAPELWRELAGLAKVLRQQFPEKFGVSDPPYKTLERVEKLLASCKAVEWHELVEELK